jgi:hypothetical protein
VPAERDLIGKAGAGMIIRAVLLTYRDGCREDRKADQHVMELGCPGGQIPERIEVLGRPYYLLKDRNRLSHPSLCAGFQAVYLLDFEKLKATNSAHLHY